MKMMQYLPVQAFGVWHHIPRFFVTKAGPALASSGSVFTKISNTVFPGLNSGNGSGEDISPQERNTAKIHEEYGIPPDMQIELVRLAAISTFGEATVGANGEAMLCAKKGPSGMWGICDDYVVFVDELVKLERNRGVTGNDGVGRAPLKVRAYFAEKDVMIGKKGQSYFEECWREKDGEFQDMLDFASETIDGVDHDTLVQSAEVLGRIFREASNMLDSGTN